MYHDRRHIILVKDLSRLHCSSDALHTTHLFSFWITAMVASIQRNFEILFSHCHVLVLKNRCYNYCQRYVL